MFRFLNFKKCLSSPNQFFKLLVVICCICFSVYQVAQCVQRLLQPPITTYYGFHLNDSMAYPRVTICRTPGFKTDLFPKYGIRSTQTVHTTNVFRNFDFDNYTIKEFLNETTYSFTEVVGSYAFSGVGFSSAIDWTSFDTTRHGKCYTIIPLEMSDVYSISGGYWFYLPHDLSEKTVDTYGGSQNGFHIYVHAANEIMASDDEQDDNFLEYIYLEAMEDIRLHLRFQEFYRVHTNTNPCVDSDENPYYSRSRCLEECLHYQIANRTNCTLPWLWMIPEDHLPQCQTVTQVSLLVSSFLRHNRQELISNCSCPMSCHVAIYTPTIISRKQMDEDTNPHGFIAMFYTNNLVTQMKEVVGYNFTAFISDIGGSLGFLLGLSVVGFIRVLEKIVCSCIKKYYGKKKTPEEEQNSETQSNVRSSFSGSTKIVDDLSLGKRNNSIQPNANMNLYENLKDFESDDFKSYQKTLVTDGNRRF